MAAPIHCHPIPGFSKISGVVSIPDATLIESVVISKDLRGLGLGRILMTQSHAYARRRGYSTVYLSTHDKQKFYAHLGYEYCTPVCSESSNAGMNAAIESLCQGKRCHIDENKANTLQSRAVVKIIKPKD